MTDEQYRRIWGRYMERMRPFCRDADCRHSHAEHDGPTGRCLLDMCSCDRFRERAGLTIEVAP